MKDQAFEEIEHCLKQYCGKLLKDLSNAEAKKRDEKLRSIFRAAHDNSYLLWTQGYKIEVVARPELPSQFSSKLTKPRIVWAHPTMHIDGTDASRDGEEIYLVTKPQVRACGNDQGENFDTWRSFDAATVTMAPKKKLEQAAMLLQQSQEAEGHKIIGINLGAGEVRQNIQRGSSQQEAAVSQKFQNEICMDSMQELTTTKKQRVSSGISQWTSSVISRAVLNHDVPTEAGSQSSSTSDGHDLIIMVEDDAVPCAENRNTGTPTAGYNPMPDQLIESIQVNSKTGSRKRPHSPVQLQEQEAGAGESTSCNANSDSTGHIKGKVDVSS